MASFEDHIAHSKKNFSFLKSISENDKDCFDWQVTVCFYIAVHLINAHLVKTCGSSFFSHKNTMNAISPDSKFVNARFPEDQFSSYRALMNLSRRSRYLCNNSDNPMDDGAETVFLTKSKELSKALYHLDVVIQHLEKLYGVKFDQIEFSILELQGKSLKHFKFKRKAVFTTAPQK